MQFSHLHNHTQYSLLDGASNIKKLFEKAQADGQRGLAITDHGNMFGVFEFMAASAKYDVKPIVGCEFYVVDDHTRKQFTKDNKDIRYHQLLLAKNVLGYENLTKLCSLGYIDGLYGKYPRITKELIAQYNEGLIATTCCIGASVPKAILKKGEAAGETEFKWWLDVFGRDRYFIELQRHNLADQDKVNEVLLKFAKKYDVNVIASNDSHYVDREDWVAHDILLCVNTGEKLSTPKNTDFSDEEAMPRGTRFAFSGSEFFLKTTAEMMETFKDLPEALDNTNIIVDQVEVLDLKKDIMLPDFEVPQKFNLHKDDKLNQWEYLRDLTYLGAKERYGELNDEITERIDFELGTIRDMGFAGYFLIVSDFIREARDLNVMVGPGRGSAAGSVVAYCVKITNIDPIKYGLLFERFLNPERKSMPDIDTDFDDAGRQKVIDYVAKKYGKKQVAQIVTYGTMASKSALKDVARVMDLPLSEANALVKLIPEKQTYDLNLTKIFNDPIGNEANSLAHMITPDEIEQIKKLREIYASGSLASEVITQAQKLEGTVRNTGIHAAGVIIAPKDLTTILPVYVAKDNDLLVTQYEGKIIEDAGVIKMDFLGLKNLSIIKECLRMVSENHGLDIDIDTIPLDDPAPYQIFQHAETNGVFQFESDGMKKHMKDLQPDCLEDLIALNALFRPGPMQYIPSYVRRKHGHEEVTYDLPEMEEYLKETHGITVYQEQVMLLSQKLAGFSKGKADNLRKAMGKKNIKDLTKLKDDFFDGANAKGHTDKKILDKIWTDWEKFAQYAFNKSHATCYAYIAYQTAYLKHYYSGEYMAALLTNSLGSIDKITFFLQECKAMGLKVLGPDVNESKQNFAVSKSEVIRFGLGGIKGAGDAAVEAIITEREANGAYTDIFDFMTRVNQRTVNKKTLEALAYAGAFDCFELDRTQYFDLPDGSMGIESLIRYAAAVNESKNSSQMSLFGSGSNDEISKPKFPKTEEWGDIQKLRFEKAVVGFYLSGHPLDVFKVEMDLCTPIESVFDPANQKKQVHVAAIVGSIQIRTAKNGNNFSIIKLEDYESSMELALFGKDHMNYSHLFQEGAFILVTGMVQTRWNQEDSWELKLQEVNLLADYRRRKLNNLKVWIDMDNINEAFVDYLESEFVTEDGFLNLTICLVDREDKIEVPLASRTKKVNLTNDLYRMLKESEDIISFKLS